MYYPSHSCLRYVWITMVDEQLMEELWRVVMEDGDEKARNGTRNQMYRWWGIMIMIGGGIGRGKDGGKGKGKGKEEQQSKQGNKENTDVGEARERKRERQTVGGCEKNLKGGCWM